MNISKAIQSVIKHYQSGDLEQAEEICRKILKKYPKHAEIMYFLGIIYAQKGQEDSATQLLEKSLHLNQTNTDAYLALGLLKKAKGELDEAIGCFQRALELKPDIADACNNLGLIYLEKQQLEEAIGCFQRVLHKDPSNLVACYGLASAFKDKGLLQEAIDIYKKSLQILPDHPFVYNNIGHCLAAQGKLLEAEEYFFNHALQLKPDELKPYETLLMIMNYNPDYDAQKIYAKHKEVARKFSEPLSSSIYAHTNDPSPNRRLKVGYVSPDFRRHSVAYFIEPVITEHNRDYFEVFCYSNSFVHDEVTKRIQQNADQWRNIFRMSDIEAAQLIRRDEVDILIDLAGYTSNNRLLLFAHKPAPVQVTWIGYPCTTGLSAIDYKIVDNYSDPPGITEQFYTEKLIRLPQSFLCYLPEMDSPDVVNPPTLNSGHITFGSFNNFPKVTQKVIAVWSKILKEINNARLIMKTPSFCDATTRNYAMGMFDREGIESERITLLPWEVSTRGHLQTYNLVDIGLDTFPYCGTTTTCEAVWMGVPVITLGGETPASRVGISLLSNIGIPELIARTTDEYIDIAVHLAADVERLQSLRGRLRKMLKDSPLCNAKKFTENLEICYQ